MFKNPGSLSNGVGNGNGMIDTRASFNSHMHDTNGGNADCGLWFNFEDEKGVLLYDCYTHDVIKIGTTAVDSETKDYTSVADKSITIIDTVKYQNFTNGKKCKLVGILMDKATGKPLLVNEKTVTIKKPKKPEKPDAFKRGEILHGVRKLPGTWCDIIVLICIYKNEIDNYLKEHCI